MATFHHVGTAVVVDHEEDREAEREARLLEPALRNGYFETENRPRRDAAWGTTYTALSAVLLVGGVVSFFTRDKDWMMHQSQEYLSDALHCSPGRGLAEEDKPAPDTSVFTAAMTFGVLGSIGMGMLYTYLLRKRAMVAVLFSVLAVAASFLGVGVLLLTQKMDDKGDDTSSAGYTFLAFGVLYLLFPVICWSRLKLTANLLKVAGQGLADNPGLAFSTICIMVSTFAVLLVQLSLVILGYANGSVVPALDSSSSTTPCVWQPNGGGMAYMALCVSMLLWTSAIGEQMALYTIAGTIGQWYYAPEGTSTRGTTKLSLGYALRPSFGSVCLAGLAITLVNLARAIVRSIRSRIGICCAWIFDMLLSWLSLFTKFSTIRMAITGESFFDSAKGVIDLLKRNGRNAFTVWWFPAFVLRMFAYFVALFYGFTISMLALAGGVDSAHMYVLGFVVTYTCAVCLSFVSSVMLNIVDSVFICWVMDCDRKQVTRVAVHEVFVQIPQAKPAEGLAVQQPDGTYAYAPSVQPMQGADNGAYAPPIQETVGHAYPSGYTAVARGDIEAGKP